MKLTTLLLSLTLAASATLFSQEADNVENNYQFFSYHGSAQLSFSSNALPINPMAISVHKNDILNIICFSPVLHCPIPNHPTSSPIPPMPLMQTVVFPEIQTFMRLKYDPALNAPQQNLLSYTSSIDCYQYNDESQTSTENTTTLSSVNQTVTFKAKEVGEQKIILSLNLADCQSNPLRGAMPFYVTIIVTITP
jgi:flagellar capping protein FliD